MSGIVIVEEQVSDWVKRRANHKQSGQTTTYFGESLDHQQWSLCKPYTPNLIRSQQHKQF